MTTEYEQMQAQSEFHNNMAEEHRVKHERRTMDDGPITGCIDYAASGTIMESAISHLRESIPDGQKERTEEAFRALRISVKLTEHWLRRKGFNV